MKAVCHIGMPKAGSTTIQAFLEQNAQALERQGFLYRRFRPSEPHQLEYLLVAFRATRQLFRTPLFRQSYKMRNLDEVDREAGRFEAWFDRQVEGSGAGAWLISSEMITATLRTRADARAVDDWLRARFDEVVYVLYLRRQDLWVASNYSESLRNGWSESLDTYVGHTRGRNYLALVRTWTAVAGRERVVLRILEPGALKDGDLIADFCAVAGIDRTGLATPTPRNESFTRQGAAFLRAVNRAVGKVFAPETTASRVLRKAGKVVASALSRAGGDKIRLTPAQSDAIMAPLAQSNEELRRLFFPERPVLFEGSPTGSPPPATLHRQATIS